MAQTPPIIPLREGGVAIKIFGTLALSFLFNDLLQGGAVTTFLKKDIPLSCSLASNVPNFEDPVCFVSNGVPQELVDTMLDYLHLIAKQAFSLLPLDYKNVY
jgi:hypothetical protein